MDNQDYWNGVERRKPVRNDVVAIAFKAGMERAAEIAGSLGSEFGWRMAELAEKLIREEMKK